MMNDQFAAQLRRHVVENADERPADGQLEAALRRTAASRSSGRGLADSGGGPSSGARLGWQVRYGLAARGAAPRACGGGRPGTPARGQARATVFQGRWTSTDTADDSTQTLVVAPGTLPSVHFEDDFSINCERRGEPSTVYLADGQARSTVAG